MAAQGAGGTHDVGQPGAGNGLRREHGRAARIVGGYEDAFDSDGMGAFLARLARFGLVAEGPPLLKPARGGN